MVLQIDPTRGERDNFITINSPAIDEMNGRVYIFGSFFSMGSSVDIVKFWLKAFQWMGDWCQWCED